MADLYEHPTVGGAGHDARADGRRPPCAWTARCGRPRPRPSAGQLVFGVPLRALSGLRWLTWVAAGANLGHAAVGLDVLPQPCRGGGCWSAGCCWCSAPGRMALTAAGRAAAAARRRARGATPAAARCTCGCGWPSGSPTSSGAANLAGAAWIPVYARALGAKVGARVDLHSVPPVTGLLTLGDGLLGRARGRPQRPLARRRRAARRRGRGRPRGPGRHPQHAGARAPGWAATPRWPRGPRWSATVPPGESWSGAPAESVGSRPWALAR